MRLRASRLGVASSGADIPLPRRVRSILSKYGASLLIPGASGVAVQTFSPGNYVESTGQTLTPVDGAVGLVVDAAGVPGPELVTNGGFDSTAGWGLGAGWSISNGEAVATASTANLTRANVAPNPVGKTYLVSLTIVSRTAGSISPQIGGSIVSLNTVGTHVFHLRPTINDATLYIPAIGFTGSIDNISVRELPGIHATQATSQNKPALRRGLVNLLLNSNAPANQSVTCAAVPHTLAIIGTGSVTIGGTGSGTLNGTGASSIATLTFTPTSGSVSFTRSGSVTQFALFQGTVTAEQILAAGGIPVTTTAPASSTIGPQYWQFDGTDDRLQLSAVPFQMSDDFAIVAATYCDPVSTSSWNSVFAASGTSDTARIQLVVESASGAINFFSRDDAGVSVQTRYAGANYGLRQNRVISAVKRGNRRSVRYEGVETPAVTIQQLGATTFQGANIGKLWSGTDYFDGDLHAIALIKGNPTDAELLTLERFLATLQGRRI